jgi:glutamine amidotransferase
MLRNTKMDEFIVDYARKGKPILGICLGMQVLLGEGWEDGREEGIGLIDGSVKRINVKKEVRLPHMGWNDVYGCDLNELRLFSGIRSNSDFYFVHSYEANLTENISVLYTNYGGKRIVAAYQKENIFGVQFHPEKSQKVGSKLLSNFVSL